MKAPAKKPNKLPKLEVYGYDNAEATKLLIEEVRTEQLKTYSLRSDKKAPQPDWEDVATLLANQINMLYTIAQLQARLEDPFVSAVATLRSELSAATRELKELRDEFSSHERTYSHEYNRDPY